MTNKILSVIVKIVRKISLILLLLLAIAMFLSILTYHQNDSSFNVATNDGKISNLLGFIGAYFADFILQSSGLAALIIPLIIAKIAIMMLKNSNSAVFYRIILLPILLLSLSTLFSFIPIFDWWPFVSFGGYNGLIIQNKLNFIPPLILVISAVFINIILIAFIFEITWQDFSYFYRYCYHITRFIIGNIIKIFAKIAKNSINNKNSKNIPSENKNFNKDQNSNSLKASSLDYGNIHRNNDNDIFSNISKYNSLQYQELKDNPDIITKNNTSDFNDDLQGFSQITPLQSNIEDKRQEDIANLKKLLKNPKKSNNINSTYQLPPIDLLIDRSQENVNKKISPNIVEAQGLSLVKVLEDFGVKGIMLGAKVGPIVTLYEFEPVAGTKASRIIGLCDDIARSMSAISARISVIPGQTAIGIELPNPKKQIIFLQELIQAKEYRINNNSLPIILGKDIAGNVMVADLAKMPHLLIAGTTGSGKSVGLNVMILSLLYCLKPNECKFIMIDPKMLELSIYDGIPHLLSPVVTEPSKAVIALKWVVAEMEERYRLMSSFAVRNIAGYNDKAEKALVSGEKLTRRVQTGYDATTGQPIVEEIEFEPKKLPFIVVIVDEMADLMLVAGKEIEGSVQRLAQMARAAGIHLIMATQRPSVDVITGVIKANFPTRISFQVTSRIDSRTILGIQGAEQLLGQGDMIYMSGGSKMTRIHGPFCSDGEIENIVNFIKNQDLSEFEDEKAISFEQRSDEIKGSNSKYDIEDDNNFDSQMNNEEILYQKAVAIVRRDNKPSISYVQRQLRIGYNKAANLIERMEKEGVVTPPNISGKREVINEE